MRGRARRDAGELPPIVYYVFDLLHLDGRSLLDVPLEQRKRLLRSVLREHPWSASVARREDGEDFLDAVASGPGGHGGQAAQQPLRARPPVALLAQGQGPARAGGRGRGLRAGQGQPQGPRALLVARRRRRLRFVGEVGSGLDDRTRRFFRGELDEHALDAPPVVNPPRIKGAAGAPRHVIRVEFTDWTADDLLRQPAYKGSRSGATRARSGASGSCRRARPPTRPRSAAPKAESAKPKAGRRRSRVDHARSDAGRWRGANGGWPPQAATPAELAALEEMGKEGNWEVGGHGVASDQPGQGAVPRAGLHEARPDPLLRHRRAGHAALPARPGAQPVALAGRRHRPLFWQKEIPKYAPAWMARWKYPDARLERDPHLHRRRPGGDDGLAGQPRRRSTSTRGPRERPAYRQPTTR
jgi:hypothetical protein